MRLRKAKREQLQQRVISLLQSENRTPADEAELEHNRQLLSWDHASKLLLDLRHIGDIQLCDKLQSDTVDDSRIFDTAWMLETYEDMILGITLDRVQQAEAACKYLKILIAKEKERRHKEKIRRFKVIK